MDRRFTGIILIFIIILTACNHTDTQLKGQLDLIESIIEKDGEQAYKMLKGMNRDSISSKSEYARYSLLMSMAMDKNYIDITSDSIIAPAVEYYRKHGSNDYKMKALYYRGVIDRNAGNNESALEYFVKAEQYVPKTEDYLFAGRIYSAKQQIYRAIYDLPKSLTAQKLAYKNFSLAKDTSRIINSLINTTSLYISLNQLDSAKYTLDTLKTYWEKLDLVQKNLFYSNLLIFTKKHNKKNLNYILSSYLKDVPEKESINWIIVADSYFECNNIDSTLYSLSKHKEYHSSTANKDPVYFHILSCIEKESGRYQRAYDALSKYINLTNQQNYKILSQDTKFTEERVSTLMQEQREKYIRDILILCIIILSLIFYLVINNLKAKNLKLQEAKNRYILLYNSAKEELSLLSELRTRNVLSKSGMEQLNERIGVLNKFIASHISQSYSQKAETEIANLMKDREKFIHSTVLSFEVSNHQFIQRLLVCGLSEWEVGICCLYAIGLRGKDIASYLQDKSFYKTSSNIRTKLNIPKNDSTINIYLTRLMEECK
ncbi:MAG: hypothetical protein II318_07730 [Bacteroidales bacterium]|nr:hypothetical protein [Bacteroidales bacterium]